MRTSKIFFSILLAGILIGGFSYIHSTEAEAISLDDEEEDMEDVEAYLRMAKKAANAENFGDAEEYLEKAEQFGIARDELKEARQYLSDRRKERADRLAREERERQARLARERQAASRRSSGGGSGGSSGGGCRSHAQITFESSGETFTGTCVGSRRVQLTSLPGNISVNFNNDNSLSIMDYGSGNCIRGSYSFSYSANAGMTCDKRVGYSGTFYLDGAHDFYTISLSGDLISVFGY